MKSHNEKAIGAADISREALDRSIEKLAQHDHDGRGSSEDAEAIYAWRRERRDLEDRVEANRAAYAVAERRAQQARLEADRVAAKARNAEMARKAKQAEKRVRALSERIDAVRADLAWLGEHVEEFDTYNRFARGDLPFVPDAEMRVRQQPGKTIPAVQEEREVWRSANGEAPTFFTQNDAGKLVPSGMNAGAYRLVRETVVVQPEQVVPPRIPARLADEIRLVDLKGEIIWPR